MKTFTVIFCLVCSVVAQDSFYDVELFTTTELNEDFANFLNLLPVDTILDIADEHYENNAGLNKTLNYIRTNKFETHWIDLFALREVNNFLVYVSDSHVNVFGLLNKFAEYFELSPVDFEFVEFEEPVEKVEFTWGFNALINDVSAVFPKDDLKALFDQKVAEGKEFTEFVQRFSTDEFKQLLQKLEASSSAEKLLKRFRKHGLDAYKLVQLVLAVFGL
uniref:Putative microvillar protein with insect allergen related repeat n=1 Tax=Nyssomyia neivai TaxID=330878 RepID=A0A1L8DRA5_9DIPT